MVGTTVHEEGVMLNRSGSCKSKKNLFLKTFQEAKKPSELFGFQR